MESFAREDKRLKVNFKSGIKLGAIYVNEYLQTSDESIYAVGDAIEFPRRSCQPSGPYSGRQYGVW